MVRILIQQCNILGSKTIDQRICKLSTFVLLAHNCREHVFTHGGEICVGGVGAEQQQVRFLKNRSSCHGAGGRKAAHTGNNRGVGNDFVCYVDGLGGVTLVVIYLDDVVGAMGLVVLLQCQLCAVGQRLAILHLVTGHGQEKRQLVFCGSSTPAVVGRGCGIRGLGFRGGCATARQGQQHHHCQDQGNHLHHFLHHTVHLLCFLVVVCSYITICQLVMYHPSTS